MKLPAEEIEDIANFESEVVVEVTYFSTFKKKETKIIQFTDGDIYINYKPTSFSSIAEALVALAEKKKNGIFKSIKILNYGDKGGRIIP